MNKMSTPERILLVSFFAICFVLSFLLGGMVSSMLEDSRSACDCAHLEHRANYQERAAQECKDYMARCDPACCERTTANDQQAP